jgi:glycosyltransferase involved in cell wall biosynthesis
MISPIKGTSLIPEILAYLKKWGIDLTWSYFGKVDGNAGELELLKTQKLAENLGVSFQLKFHGFMELGELMSVYRSSDIFVLPTLMEAIPRVILEAQAAGLPVITTSVGGIPQAVESGVDGLLTSPGNAEEMARAIQKLIRDPVLRRALIVNGLKTAQRFTLEAETQRMVKKVENIYYPNVE